MPFGVVGDAGGGRIPGLEVADRDVAAVFRLGDAGRHGERVRVYEDVEFVLRRGAGEEFAPGVEALAVEAVDAVDAFRVRFGVAEHISRAGRQCDVGVDVDDPIREAQVLEPYVDGFRLIERTALAEDGRLDAVDAPEVARLDSVVIVGSRHDDEVVERIPVEHK